MSTIKKLNEEIKSIKAKMSRGEGEGRRASGSVSRNQYSAPLGLAYNNELRGFVETSQSTQATAALATFRSSHRISERQKLYDGC